jgi:hypothetical protein
MKRSSIGILFTILLVSFLVPIQAQTADQSPGANTTAAGRLSHDVSAEVRLAGTVLTVLPKGAAGTGMIAGSHLLLATPAGEVDASLGRFGLQGKEALSLVAGQQIQASGVVKIINGKPVLLVRTVKAGGEVYLIRNEHGFPVSPQARARAAQMSEKSEKSEAQ